ncbi:hypothetical protein Cgig2_022617 [Carnegiea gigantea]|uniref:U6 snRNA-associated Sm-like protein LSm1 n=1 Tax=Carnegiea gigantea TaxID=171969 RepID=A0A9Q1JUS1_9CARY|nr:hypothetical protein Cgig2_022617 [Carnegiea gigantea]
MSWAGPEDLFLSTSLATYLDRKLLVLLRDGRKLLGTLRSFDQFGIFFYTIMSFLASFCCLFAIYLSELFVFDAANVVLEGACERVIVGDLYCDIPLGLYIIRGENVVLIGELMLSSMCLSAWAWAPHRPGAPCIMVHKLPACTHLPGFSTSILTSPTPSRSVLCVYRHHPHLTFTIPCRLLPRRLVPAFLTSCAAILPPLSCPAAPPVKFAVDKEELPPHMTRVTEPEIREAQKAERVASDLKGTMRKRMEFLDFD